MDPVLYFAYGSNLCSARARERAPGVVALWPAHLPGFELRWHKRSTDGSGKCNIVPTTSVGAEVHGVVYRVPGASKGHLDEIEGLGVGYGETLVRVTGTEGGTSAWTYVANGTHIDDSLLPYAWYKELVVRGAADHALPQHYVDALRAVPSVRDRDAERRGRHLACLPCEQGG